MKTFYFVISLFFANHLAASETSVAWRSYVHSCGYFSNQSVDLELTFNDAHLPGDATVKLIYGVGSKEQKRDWERRQEIMTSKVGLSNTRTAQLALVTAARGYPEQYSLIQFVWEIRLANGHVHYDQGGPSTWGFYEGRIWDLNISNCVSPGKKPPEFQTLQIYSVDRE